MPPRIPTSDDFASLKRILPHTLHFPDPPESMTAALILFHGLGDSETPFHNFARNVNLPGVLAISVRGPSPLPPSLLPDNAVSHTGPTSNFHWGDDINMDPSTGELDDDPGYEKATGLVMDKLVNEVLIQKCGWEWSDVLFFGFGQGGTLALGIAARLAAGQRVKDVSEGEGSAVTARKCKGVVSIGGGLPQSMVSTVSGRSKSGTGVMLVQLGSESVDAVKREFADVRVTNWKRRDIAMPSNREEMFPIMKFLADRLNDGWPSRAEQAQGK